MQSLKANLGYTQKPVRSKKKVAHSLPRAILEFLSFPGPKIILTATLLVYALRIFFVFEEGAPGLWDAFIPLMILAAWPFQEWLIHVVVLHWKPRTLLGVKLDPFVSQKHRAHHVDPWDLTLTLTPLRGIATIITLNAVFWSLAMPTWSLAFTGMCAYMTLGLLYEWTHYLIHSKYRPKRAFYKKLWKSHRLHHCKNEHYWYGVSMTLGDKVLRTAPDHEEVETSPTCRVVHPEE